MDLAVRSHRSFKQESDLMHIFAKDHFDNYAENSLYCFSAREVETGNRKASENVAGKSPLFETEAAASFWMRWG